MNIVLLTVTAFILLREVHVSDRAYAFLAPLGRASFGIYLVHVIVITELSKIPFIAAWFSAGSSIYMIPLLGLFGFLASYVVVAIVQKIPVLRWSMP
ncbi:MAG: hypothetical protein IPL71_22980 [Anaerolineales bacterium]|uniref:hypothetical protein n=1 Tax=Candidatus Villigracilis proximus TaxID=3140683 RepID=UPI0031362186|nr:hypothetical protein [Anaerolineales bacterium]